MGREPIKKLSQAFGSPRPLIDWYMGTPRIVDWKDRLQQVYHGQPDFGDPNYNYDAAFRNGVLPENVPYDSVPHWPSAFKGASHPNRFIRTADGILDTLNGAIVPADSPMTPAQRSNLQQGSH